MLEHPEPPLMGVDNFFVVGGGGGGGGGACVATPNFVTTPTYY